MDVTLPNGKIITGIPDGTPKEVVRQKAIQAGLAKESDFPQEQTYSQVEQQGARKQGYEDVASDVGVGEAALIGMGKGFANIGRGLGIMDPEDEGSKRAMAALSEQHPYATGAGEIAGEALPFVAPGMAAARIPSMLGRVGASVGIGGAEGGLIAAGTDQDVVPATGVGAAIGGVAEVLFPVLGRLGRSLYQRVNNSAPRGAMLDMAGRPTEELQTALDKAGMTFDDLTADAVEFVKTQKPGADPAQVAKAARFSDEGVPITQGELTDDFAQQTTEQRLLESASDQMADPLRAYKLRQSESIKGALTESLDTSKIPEETGALIVDSLAGRKKLLRTQKNDLYTLAAENAKEHGGIPMLVDGIDEALPDANTLRRIDRVSGGVASEVQETLAEYGLTEPTEAMLKGKIDPEILNIGNFEDLRQTLLQLERKDQTGAASVVIRPIIDAMDKEADELASILKDRGLPDNVIAPLKEARKTVRKLKTEFSPQSITGRLIDVKRDGVTPIIEASKVYSNLAAKSQPVENVRKTVSSLLKSGDKGKQAVADLQTTTMLDLIDAGFGTESRKISGTKVFNPIAFRKRIDALGKDKLAAIFANNKPMLGKINNIERIAGDLIPPSGAQPKGSGTMIYDLMNKLGVIAITSKMPGGQLLIEQMRRLADSSATRAQVETAVAGSPELKRVAYMFDESMPGIASALGIAGLATAQQENENP